MPGLHNKEKFKLVGCWCDKTFLEEIEKARGNVGRSQFVRDALVEKLERLGIKIPRELTIAPDRAGKGGPRKTTKSPARALNVRAISSKETLTGKILKVAHKHFGKLKNVPVK